MIGWEKNGAVNKTYETEINSNANCIDFCSYILRVSSLQVGEITVKFRSQHKQHYIKCLLVINLTTLAICNAKLYIQRLLLAS